MTPEEIRETLFGTLAKLDAEFQDRRSRDNQAQMEKKSHSQEIANLEARHKAELDRERAARMETENASTAKDKKIAEIERALEDAHHKVDTMNRDIQKSAPIHYCHRSMTKKSIKKS